MRQVGAPLSQGIPLRPARDREPGRRSGSFVLNGHHPADTAAAQGAATTRRSGTPSRTNRRSRPSRARRRTSSPLRSRRSTPIIVVDWAMRYGNPSIASRLEALVDARLRAHPGDAALSAICGGHHRDRRRRGVPRAGALRDQPALRMAAPYYDDAGLYRGAGVLDRRDARQARRSSRRSSWRRSTACRRTMSTRAIPTTTIASRPCGCCASSSSSTKAS